MDKQSLNDKVEKLESSVEQLLAHYKTISDENAGYQKSNKELLVERSELISKNDKVRAQVEAMIDRLKVADKTS